MSVESSLSSIYAGQFRHSLDRKNRVTIPSRWRRQEVEEFFTVPNPEPGCLIVFPPAEFEKMYAQTMSDERISPADRRVFVRQLHSRTQHCVGDKQGRIVLAEEQCRQVGLEGEVILVGGHSRFEIWNPKNWEMVSAKEAATYQHVAANLGL